MLEYDMSEIIDTYHRVREARLPKIQKFWNDDGLKYLVMQRVPARIWKICNTLEVSFQANIACLIRELDVKTDHIPYLEPWFGVGVFANAYGCKYYWRDDEAPATHVLYHRFEELKARKQQSIENTEIMNMVMDGIRYFKEQTYGELPISLTDTQSAFDTITLIFDPTQFFMSCYDHPEEIKEILNEINDLVIAFSQRQKELIGDKTVWPGHIMLSDTSLSGISISDDNLSICSPDIDEEFALPCNQKLADTFGGIAIHSCGRWESIMALIARKMTNVVMVECALGSKCDPNHNDPEAVRDALKGSPIILSARVGNDLDEIDSILDKLYDPSLRMIISTGCADDQGKGEKHYDHIVQKLESLYSSK